MDAPTFLKITSERVALCRWDGTRENVDVSIDRS
jgi:hypothetical protein